MTKKNAKTKGGFGASDVLFGFLISFLAMLATSLIASIILYMQADPTPLIDVASLIVLLVTAAVSGYIISKRTSEQKMLTVVLSSLLLCFLLFVIGMIITAGGVTNRVYLNYLCYIGVAILFAWLGGRAPARRRRHRH